MAASKSVSWSTSKAGYDPGQRQSLTVSFKERKHKKVVCHVSFSAVSLGQDDYTASQRHNNATISIQRKKDSGDWVTVGSHSWGYQLHGGAGTSTSHVTDFSFEGPYDVTSFRVIYNNARVGTNTPNYGPKSTGKVENANLGTLKVDDCDKVKIKYSSGLNKDAIGPDDRTTLGAYNLPDDKEIYWGKDFTISNKKPKDRYTNYVFTGWDVGDDWKINSKTKKPRKVNTTNPKYTGGQTYKDAESNVHLYACWAPAQYTYRFYPTQADAENRTHEWTELAQKRSYGGDALDVPDIRTNQPDSKYYKQGYHCIGWQHWINQKQYKEDVRQVPRIVSHLFDDEKSNRHCSLSQDAYSWPLWESNEGSIKFDYGYDGRIAILTPYVSGDSISLLKYCTATNGGDVVNPTDIRAGYKLIGWTTVKPEKDYYLMTDNLPTNFAYNSTWSANILEGASVTLYAVWQLQSTLYVYTNQSISNGIQGKAWKLVVPYVYIEEEGKWKQGTAQAYTSLYVNQPGEENPRWKL